MAVVALVSDLALQSQLRAAASRTNVELVVANSVEAMLERVAAQAPVSVILDLSHPGLDPRLVVEQIRAVSPSLPVAAFGPHVHVERLDAARQAHCDPVLSRGQFHSQMDAILRQLDAQGRTEGT
jgi:CheY-like chemotaxis protein